MWLAEGSKNLVIQIAIFLVYIFLGAVIFQALESHNEEEEREAMHAARNQFQKKYNISHDDMKIFISKIEEIVDHGFSQDWVKRWTILGSLFFAGTVVTTIGKYIQFILQYILFWSNSGHFLHAIACQKQGVKFASNKFVARSTESKKECRFYLD